MKPLTTLAGTLFLLWFLFSPIAALYSYFSIFPESSPSYFLIVYIVFVYVFFGFFSYYIAKSCGGIFKKPQTPVYLNGEVRRSSPWYAGVIYLVALAPALFSKYIIQAAAVSPSLSGILGVLIFCIVALANWYPPFRKRVNFWLTLEKDGRVAYAHAEPTLYALNGFLVFLSGILVVVSLL